MRTIAAISTLVALSALPKCDACAPKTLQQSAVVLARSPSRMSMTMLDDETIVLDANVQVFEVKSDDSLSLLGDFAAYEPYLPPTDDPGAAYRVPSRSLYGTRELLEARGIPQGDQPATSFVWSGTRWEKKQTEPAKPPPYDWSARYVRAIDVVHHIDEPNDLALPQEFSPSGFTKTKDGTRIAFGLRREPGNTSNIPVTAIALPNEKIVKLVEYEPLATYQWYCHPIPSADGKTYAACTVPENVGDPERRLYRLEGNAWKRVPLLFRGPPYTAIAIAKDGVPWIAKDDPAAVVRVASDRPPEEIALAGLGANVEQATYVRRFERGYWNGMTTDRAAIEGIATSKLEKPMRVLALVPRPSGNMLVLAKEEKDEATVLYRIGQGELPIAKRIGSEPDQLVAIENATRETLKWVGHCHQVFVELPDANAARATAERANGDSTVWTAVQGRLKKRAVFGVVALSIAGRRDAVDGAFERTVTTLVEEVTKNPASPPPVTCSLPVLDRVL